MPDSMISTINNWDMEAQYGHLVFANGRGIPYTWNRSAQPAPKNRTAKEAAFPDIPAELPEIAITQAEEAQALDIAAEEEAEAAEVEEGTDLDREVPHLAFGQRDQALEEYDIGNVDMVPTEGLDKQQLIGSISNPTNVEDLTPEGSVTDLMQELNQVQDEIESELQQINDMGTHSEN